MLLACWYVDAQNFTEKANLQSITTDGFYSISITPQLSSYITVDYKDLRIADDKSQFVPYVIVSKPPSFIA